MTDTAKLLDRIDAALTETRSARERVALALYNCGEGVEGRTEWPLEVSEKTKGFWLAYADAAIEAMPSAPAGS